MGEDSSATERVCCAVKAFKMSSWYLSTIIFNALGSRPLNPSCCKLDNSDIEAPVQVS